MQTTIVRWSTNLFGALSILMLYLIISQKRLPDLSFLTVEHLYNFKILFISIILEALPFVLLGVLISALLQMFVSERTIQRWIPSNPILGVLFSCTAGVIFPLCECGMIPVIRRLMQKGMPAYIAVVFILCGPIINPVVFASTYMAFRSRPEIAYSRMALAFIAAVIIGLVIFRFAKGNPLREKDAVRFAGDAGHHHEAFSPPGHSYSHSHFHSHPHSNSHPHPHQHGTTKSNRIVSLLGHASDEFFDMGKYLIFGAFLTALIQTFMEREQLFAIGQGGINSHLFMMGLGYVLSLCSTSDAFVASSFTTTFSTGSLLTFLVFGPMLDIKSTLMLLSAFRAGFVIRLSLLVSVVVLVASLIFERVFF